MTGIHARRAGCGPPELGIYSRPCCGSLPLQEGTVEPSAGQLCDSGCLHVQVYKNNGLPVGAAVGLPLGAVALAAGLLYLSHLKGKRTARCLAFFDHQSGPAPDAG